MKNVSVKCLVTSALLLAVTLGASAQTAITNASPWTGSVAAGLTLTRGNSKTLLATIDGEAKRKWDANELLLDANGAYGDANDVKNAESAQGSAQFNHLETERFYYGAKLDALTDVIAGINYRLSLAPLAGYYFIKTTNDSLAGEIGPAGVLQKLGDTTRGYATLRLAERYEHKFSDTAKLWESFEIMPQVDRFKNYYFNFEIGAEAALTKKISLRTYLQDTYYNIPASGRLKNDVKLVGAVAYKF